ncbi:MAG: phasin family protein [Xanthobacteraceae bacterium]|jgi:phasin
MAEQTTTSFQVPSEMRAFAEQSVEQAKKAFDSVMTAAQSAASAIEGQTVAAQAGAKDVQRKAVAFAERNVDASFDFARKLVAAKDSEEVMKLHADYVKAHMQALSDQARELGQTAARATGAKLKD